MRAIAAVLCAICLCADTAAYAQLRGTTIVSGLSQPVAFAQDPSDPSIQYVVEQVGRVRIVRNGVLAATPFLDLSDPSIISAGGERGLLGIAFPANYGVSGRFFVYFNNPAGDIVVARFLRSAGNPLIANPASRLDLQWSTGERVIRHPTFANHNGGTMQFGPDGNLYVGTGDGGSGNDPANNAQNMSQLLGKILRIDVSGNTAAGFTVPFDNPFPAAPRPEIWDVGVRNPWKYSFDDPGRGGTGALIIGDVGQDAWEEVDYEPAGRGGNNYGWRNREGAHDNVTTDPPAFLPLVDPIFEYPHPTGFSITGGYVYRGSALGAAFRGRYVFGDFVSKKIWSLALTIDPATGRATASDLRDHTAELAPGNVSSFGVDAAGELYYLDYSAGAVVRVSAAVQPGSLVWIDQPAPSQGIAQPFLISGWALDTGAAAGSGAGIDAVHVWAFPITGIGGPTTGTPRFLGATTTAIARPDVAGAFGASQFTQSGFAIVGQGLPPGPYRLAAYGLVHATGTFDAMRAVDVFVVSQTIVTVDVPRPGAVVGASFVVGGWAIDWSAQAGTGVDAVHVWALPASGNGSAVFLGATTAFSARPDVGAAFGARFTNSGYTLLVNALPPGTWFLTVFAHSAATGVFQGAVPVVIVR